MRLSTLVLSLFLTVTLCATAQNNGEKVKYVDDEDCGCELVFIDGIQTTERNKLFGFKREDGTVICEPKYMYVDRFHGDYCKVYTSDTTCGMIDRNGREIVPPVYNAIRYPSEGLIAVGRNGMWGFIDTAGRTVIKPQYRTVSDFKEGLAVVLIDFDSFSIGYGYIDTTNTLVIPAIYEYAETFNEGYAVVVAYERYGMIDHNNREVLPCKYLRVTSMMNGCFFAVDELEEKAALFNNKFKRLTGFVYSSINGYNEDYYVVGRDGKKTFLGRNGKEYFGMYDNAGVFYDGYAKVSNGGKWGIINKRGKIILPIEYDDGGMHSTSYTFSENLALVEKDGKIGFVNKHGKIVIPIEYESAHHCTEGLIPVKKNGMWGYVDKGGRLVCDFLYDAATHFTWGRATVAVGGTSYRINPDGECVKACKTYPKYIKWNFKH